MAHLNSAVAPQHITRKKNELQKEKRKIYPLKRILIYIISKDSVRTAQ